MVDKLLRIRGSILFKRVIKLDIIDPNFFMEKNNTNNMCLKPKNQTNDLLDLKFIVLFNDFNDLTFYQELGKVHVLRYFFSTKFRELRASSKI